MTYDICIASCGPHTLIADCLRAVRENSSDYRLLWLSNGAPEETILAAQAEIVKLPPDAGHIVIYSPENVGTIKGYNALFALSTAPFIVTMNDDVEVVPGWLENMRRLFELPGVGLAAPAVTTGGKLTASLLGAPRPAGERDTRFLDGLPTYCAMISRDCFTRVGYLNEELAHLSVGDDDDFNIRARREGFRFAVDLRTVVKHRHQASSLAALGGPEEKRKKHLAAAKYLQRKYGTGSPAGDHPLS